MGAVFTKNWKTILGLACWGMYWKRPLEDRLGKNNTKGYKYSNELNSSGISCRWEFTILPWPVRHLWCLVPSFLSSHVAHLFNECKPSNGMLCKWIWTAVIVGKFHSDCFAPRNRLWNSRSEQEWASTRSWSSRFYSFVNFWSESTNANYCRQPFLDGTANQWTANVLRIGRI